MNSSANDWARLLRIARCLIEQVNAEQSVIDRWTFGGGTALMLQIGHRDSRDVDIFLPDPQYLALLDPQKRDFAFEVVPADYQGDGSKFLKLAFDAVGEIDFIVAQTLTARPATAFAFEGRDIPLETVPEIITKKVCYRGANIKPRDIFDIAAAAELDEVAIIEALKRYPEAIKQTLDRLGRLNRQFVDASIAQLAIRDNFRSLAPTAFDRTTALLSQIKL